MRDFKQLCLLMLWEGGLELAARVGIGVTTCCPRYYGLDPTPSQPGTANSVIHSLPKTMFRSLVPGKWLQKHTPEIRLEK